MAKRTTVNDQTPTGDIVMADGEPLNLYNPYLAAVLAWLIPGAGHYYQRRNFKAAIFFTSITACFVIGLIVSGGRCVYACWNRDEHRWQFILQSGVGVPAIPAAIQGWRKSNNKPALFKGLFFPKHEPAPFAAPDSLDKLDEWNKKTASGFELGTLYTMIAGLLNILVVYDAFAGPLPPPAPKKKGKPEDDENSKSNSKA
ncbi:MAG: DUF6677 family protein [Pirellulales bacterium]